MKSLLFTELWTRKALSRILRVTQSRDTHLPRSVARPLPQLDVRFDWAAITLHPHLRILRGVSGAGPGAEGISLDLVRVGGLPCRPHGPPTMHWHAIVAIAEARVGIARVARSRACARHGRCHPHSRRRARGGAQHDQGGSHERENLRKPCWSWFREVRASSIIAEILVGSPRPTKRLHRTKSPSRCVFTPSRKRPFGPLAWPARPLAARPKCA